MSNVNVSLPATRTVNVGLTEPTVNLDAVVGEPGQNEIHIGPTEPTDPNVEFWWKTDTVAGVWNTAAWDNSVWV